MSKFSNQLFILIIGLLYAASVSCSNNTTTNTKTRAADTVAATWVNPRKGRIWEKESIVKIPLTAVENELRGQVKSVGYKEYEFSGTGSAKDLVDSGCNVYDNAGHLVNQDEYYADKSPKWHCVYKYDDKNKPNEWDLNIYDDDMNSKTTFSYDAKGNKTEEVTANVNGKPLGKTGYKYDDKGNEAERSIYDQGGKLKQVIAYQYDQHGFQVSYTEKGADGEVFTKLTCVYDNNGNKVSGADYSDDTTLEGKWEQKNDAMGRRIETDYFAPDGTLLEKRNIKYDDHGYAVEYNTYKKDSSLDEMKSYSYQNEYDKTGNIVKQTEIRWKDGKRIPVTYVEYVLVYY